MGYRRLSQGYCNQLTYRISQTYHLTTTLFVLTNPVFCLLQHLYAFSTIPLLSLLSALSMIPSLYIIVLSCLPSAIPWAGASVLLLVSPSNSFWKQDYGSSAGSNS